MNGKGDYKFRVMKGVLCWKSNEMERFMPVSAEILTRVLMLYEKEIKNGLDLWNAIEAEQKELISPAHLTGLYQELIEWMESLKTFFGNTETFNKKNALSEEFEINLN